MQRYMMGDEDMGDTANVGKDLILNKLLDDKILSQKQFEEYAGEYFVVLKKPKIISMFENVLKKIFSEKENKLDKKYYILSKVEKTCETNLT